MRKTLLAMLVALACVGATAQKRFVAMPDMSLGYCKMGDNLMGAWHSYEGGIQIESSITLGVAIGQESTTFAGIMLGAEDLIFMMDDPNNNGDCVTEVTSRVMSKKVGLQVLHKTSNGFTIGGVFGIKIWDDKININDIRHNLIVDNETIIKAKVGYTWTHCSLLGYIGKDGGFCMGATVAFPIYRVE